MNAYSRIALSVAFAVFLVLSVALTGKTVFAQGKDNDVEFISNMDKVRGHMEQSLANKEKGELALSKVHASHPIAELYSLMEPEISEHDAQLNTKLKSALTALSGKVDSSSPTEFKQEIQSINDMLDSAAAAAVSENKRSDLQFNAKVINSVLSTAKAEYSESVENGKVAAMVEYEDAQGFIGRAEARFDAIANRLPEHQREETTKFFIDLNNATTAVQEPSSIEQIIDRIITEVNEGAGVQGAETEQTTSVQYIENAKNLLQQVSTEYSKGNYAQADKLAVSAYLDNFEHVEGELVAAGSKDLMDELEQMMRVEIRDMIKNRVPQEQLDSHIQTIDSKLDQAIRIVPEFPMSTLSAVSSVIGAAVMITRFRASLFSGGVKNTM